MLKNIFIILCAMTLMSCQENQKAKIQKVIDDEDYVTAKVLVDEMLNKKVNDAYYNGAMGYILSVECVSTNCPKNSPDDLEKIRHYMSKSMGLVPVSNAYFIDYYQKIMENITRLAVKQESRELAIETLEGFVNQKNPRIDFIYKQLYTLAIKNVLTEDIKTSSQSFALLQDLNFKLTAEQKLSVDLLMSLENNKPVSVMKDKIKSFNRAFIGKQLPQEFLVALAPVLTEYALTSKNEKTLDVIEKSVSARNTILGENVAVLRDIENIKYYAKGLELISESEVLINALSEEYSQTPEYFKIALQNISLKLNPANAELWADYLALLLEQQDLKKLYLDINIEILSPEVVIANNDAIITHASSKLEEGTVIPLLNELVYRDDSNKKKYTEQTIALVEKALKLEMEKNNLDGIFEYLNYIPSVKEKFTKELEPRLQQYIAIAWENNNFKDLNRLVGLYNDLNKKQEKSIVLTLYEDFLLSEKSQNFFKAQTVKEYIGLNNADIDTAKDMDLKYEYVSTKIRIEDLHSAIFSVARKMEGLYTQSRVFGYFSDSFTEDKRDDLIIDSTNASLDQDQGVELQDLVNLAGFLLEKTNRLPKDFIKNRIMPSISSVADMMMVWEIASEQTRNKLVAYNSDIKNLIKAVENDKANKKISASVYIEKIKSKEILPFLNTYKTSYNAYAAQALGYYVREKGTKGPEIIKISKTDSLLKVKVDFISRLGKLENLDKYKLDRGEVVAKSQTVYYNPVTNKINLKGIYSLKEQKVFAPIKELDIQRFKLTTVGQDYKKVDSLFELNRRYGIVKQVTQLARDNFHILPEGTSFELTNKLSDNAYTLKLNHPAMPEAIEVTAKHSPETAELSFEYDYTVNSFEKTYAAKAKCQLVDTRAYCAAQDKYWKRASYSVVSKGLQVK